jgi:hypothetical protein
MRIALQNGGTTYWLAGEPGVSVRVHSPVKDFVLSGDRQLDVANVVRANFTRQFDRLGQVNEVSFGTFRLFDTADEAFLFELDYLDDIPLTGTLLFEIDIPGGGTHTRVMANAIMQRPEMSATGETVELEFTVTGGAITGESSIGKYLTPTGGGYLTPTGGYYLTGT